MSLIDECMESAHIIDRTTTSDGYGSVKTTYAEGASIMAAFTYDTSAAARIAGQDGVSDTYHITTKMPTSLSYHDIVKRDSDGQIFRVATSGGDNHTPESSSLGISQVTAQRWELPDE